VFDLMTRWIERYRRQAEDRFHRLDAVLADMDDDQDALRRISRPGVPGMDRSGAGRPVAGPGMEDGVVEGYVKLDALLARG
jgi:hypothetical protein